MANSNRIIDATDGVPAALAASQPKRVRPGKRASEGQATTPERAEPVVLPVAADIAAVTIIEAPAAEPVELIRPTAAAPADTIQEEPAMATTAETITETTTATGAKIFADMNDRAKSAAERGTKLFDEMNALNKGNVEALVESGRIAARGVESMAQEAADYARRSFETATANFRTLATVKSPAELMKLQADYTRAAFDQAVAQTSHSTEAMLKLAGEIAQPISNRFAVVADRIKTAA